MILIVSAVSFPRRKLDFIGVLGVNRNQNPIYIAALQCGLRSDDNGAVEPAAVSEH